MGETLASGYEPHKTEEGRYARWETARLFSPDRAQGGAPWSLVIPPPNVTGVLHIGHALEQVMMDAITRVRRMQGHRALYLPGVDHAGIATQNMVEAELRAEKLSRHDLGRERFVERTWQWKERYHERIRSQIRRLGASCDWERERFTLDPLLSAAVRKVFVDLHQRGLAYRAPRIINWCVRCRTALSDLEVKFETQIDQLYSIHYPRPDGSEGLTVATVRPETMFGDVAVAVNPADERYRALVGKTVLLPLMESEIPVIADAYVNPAFGTGALKITPGHDPNDYEVGQRHHLPTPGILTPDGHLQGVPARFLGLPVAEARQAAVSELAARGLLRRTEDYSHNVGRCDRCSTVVEPLISTQWFVRTAPLGEKAAAAVRNGEIRFVPERWSKVFLDWLDNIRDWCVSRQLWWGHRIPAWYCDSCPAMVVALEAPAGCPDGHGAMRQDEDVLDTWFSSGLWPFSTLGWPEGTPDLRAFYPTTLLITGYDIIFFWVARMTMLGLEFTGEVPFRKVCIHGLVRDEKGQKMSKTKGNVVDPMVLADQHGVDPLRFGLASLTTQGQDFSLTEDKFQSARFFLNKLWNASRFVLMNTPADFQYRGVSGLPLTAVDRWILVRLGEVTEEVTRLYDDVELAPIAKTLYGFTWNEFCDWYLELAKLDFQGPDPERKDRALQVLHTVLRDVLKLLHPLVPFATDAIWEALPGGDGALPVAPWPAGHGVRPTALERQSVDDLIAIIGAIRSLRSDLTLPPSEKAEVLVRAADADAGRLQPFEAAIRRLANLATLTWVAPGGERIKEALYASFGSFEIYLKIGSPDLIAREVERLRKELDKNLANRQRMAKKLDNPQFLAKAAAAIIAKDRATLDEADAAIRRLEERIARLRAE